MVLETVLRPARLALFVAAASLTGLARPAVAEPLYQLTDLGPLPGSNWSDAHSINNAGEVIADSPTWRDLSPQGEGIWPLVVRAARYRGGSGTIVTPDPGFTATGLNNHGDVLGWSSSPGTAGGAFIYHRDGTATRVDGVPVGPNSHTRALNDSGQLVWNADSGSENARAYLWTGGVSRPIAPPGYQRVSATGLNNSGQVIGYGDVPRSGPGGGAATHGFLWRDGAVEDLGNLGSQFVIPFAINDAGQVTGESNVLPGGFYDRHAFLYSDGTMHDLGTIGGPFSMGFAINARGDVVGVSSYKPEPRAETLGVDRHAFLYTDGRMIDLNDVISQELGWTLLEATGINDLGQIIGNAWTKGGGAHHGFLLTPAGLVTGDPVPVPEPGPLALLAFAAASGARRVIRRFRA